MIHQLAVNQESMEQSRKGNNIYHNNGNQGGKAKDVDAMDVDEDEDDDDNGAACDSSR